MCLNCLFIFFTSLQKKFLDLVNVRLRKGAAVRGLVEVTSISPILVPKSKYFSLSQACLAWFKSLVSFISLKGTFFLIRASRSSGLSRKLNAHVSRVAISGPQSVIKEGRALTIPPSSSIPVVQLPSSIPFTH